MESLRSVMHSVGTGDTLAAELDTASESHAAVVEDDERTPDLEVNTGAAGLSAGEGTDEMANDISVLSCYATKSWMRDDEKGRVTAFRVCVSADERGKIMDTSLWSKGIVIRDWRFKWNSIPSDCSH